MPVWFTPFLLLLDALAVFRLTWLVTQDTMPFGPLRDSLDRERPDSKLTELINCPWCVSAYVAPVVLGLHALAPGVWPYIAVVLTFSAVAGLLSTLLE